MCLSKLYPNPPAGPLEGWKIFATSSQGELMGLYQDYKFQDGVNKCEFPNSKIVFPNPGNLSDSEYPQGFHIFFEEQKAREHTVLIENNWDEPRYLVVRKVIGSDIVAHGSQRLRKAIHWPTDKDLTYIILHEADCFVAQTMELLPLSKTPIDRAVPSTV